MKQILWLIYALSITIHLYSQSCSNANSIDELFRRRHHIDGMTIGHPYTTFDRHNGLSLDETIANIKKRITEDYLLYKIDNENGPVFQAYKDLYNNAISAMPDDDGLIRQFGDGTKITSSKSVWAKNNAFVFLIGLDGAGNFLDTPGFTAARNNFRDHALTAFDNISGSIPPHSFGTITLSNTDDGNMQFYARALSAWLQAYDLLKAAYEVSDLRATAATLMALMMRIEML